MQRTFFLLLCLFVPTKMFAGGDTTFVEEKNDSLNALESYKSNISLINSKNCSICERERLLCIANQTEMEKMAID